MKYGIPIKEQIQIPRDNLGNSNIKRTSWSFAKNAQPNKNEHVFYHPLLISTYTKSHTNGPFARMLFIRIIGVQSNEAHSYSHEF